MTKRILKLPLHHRKIQIINILNFPALDFHVEKIKKWEYVKHLSVVLFPLRIHRWKYLVILMSGLFFM